MFFLIGMQGFSKDSFPKECCVIPYRKNVPGRTVRTCEWKEWRSLKQTSSPCAEMGSELIHFSKDVLTTIPLAVLICSRLSNGWLLLHSWHRRSSCIFRYAKHNEVWRLLHPWTPTSTERTFMPFFGVHRMLYLTSANLRASLKTNTCFGEVRRVSHKDMEIERLCFRMECLKQLMLLSVILAVR